MFHTLILTNRNVGDTSEVVKVRAVRDALRVLKPNVKITAHDADVLLEEAREEGWALMGESEDLQGLSNLAGGLAINGLEALIDYDPDADEVPAEPTPEQVFADHSPEPEAVAEPDTAPVDGEAVHDVTGDEVTFSRSVAGYETALACLAHASGDPLRACAYAHTLGRTSESEQVYGEAIMALVDIFPWIADKINMGELAEWTQS